MHIGFFSTYNGTNFLTRINDEEFAASNPIPAERLAAMEGMSCAWP